MGTPNALELILALHQKDGTGPISKLPDFWHRKLNEHWEFWVNGHMQPMTLKPLGTEIHPGDCYVQFNGWPAGIFSIITGQGTIAAGSEANYFTFCEALEKALQEGK